MKKENRFNYIQTLKYSKEKVCFNCNREQPKYSKDGLTLYIQRTIDGEIKKVNLNAEDALDILKNISDEDIELLGFSPINSRPEWMICKILPIAPPCVRPSVKHSTNLKSEDDMVYKYLDII